MSHEEDRLHTHIWRALQILLPDDVVAWSNENRRNGQREGARRKARGCIAGVPDMQFTHAGRTLYVEIKTPTGTVSKEQRALHKRLKVSGASVAVCRSLDDVISFLSREGISLRGEVMA
ncbi:VRR-NUC domain-containing protein [Gluconobacter roseus]|uniref:VRR-NUC domain-containing protein n=1 Tax=Gluconobacter roseus NBRC 3990 TaxID=1307950 RepID=A0A4Y3M3Q6_9PROT|nr:VRR-NUC domain-containing protein [Gluconobacter roseus]KXV43074.1 hypothetical protein AD943_08800 [Gluconobacter roseus]GBR43318.1 hypothetical protein AA3990_0386 [Gluconobacter roseus NBRC 3990]GEB03920.1 hypothetical protein GRO01_14960 [Gluconobacter roseus NBRC 3990]GLP94373.1 hypothetical protein GCM10007871_23510 [Gluconobacter roseus NBRC 3990]